MQGKELYDAVHEFADELDMDVQEEAKQDKQIDEGVKLGIHLLADIGESLNRIADAMEEHNS